jgi:carbon-monoxide dehydrogenase medium subunit
MLDFDLVRPSSLADAIDLLDTDDPSVRAFSGGTALMLMMKSGVFEPSVLVDLSGVEAEHAQITVDASGSLRIGGLASLSQLEHDSDAARIAPVITRAMKRLSNVRVRNVARVGGCLAHGDPHMDLPPILASLRAHVIATGPGGEREFPVEDLFAGYYETTLRQGELIAAVRVPPQSGWRTVYRKTTVRTHDDWPTLGVAVSLLLAGPRVRDARVIVSAATEKLTRVTEVEALLTEAELDEGLLHRAGELAAATVETIEDAQGSAAYKKVLVGVEVRRALAEAWIEQVAT